MPDTMALSDDAGLSRGPPRPVLSQYRAADPQLGSFTDKHLQAQQRLRALIWWFYADLKVCHRDPDQRRRADRKLLKAVVTA
jgi:hypothetical protein